MTDRPDLQAMQLRHELQGYLGQIADQGEPVDGGGGCGSEDIHVTVGGVRFHIEIHWPEVSA